MKFAAGEHQNVVTDKSGGVICKNCGQKAPDFDKMRQLDCSFGYRVTKPPASR